MNVPHEPGSRDGGTDEHGYGGNEGTGVCISTDRQRRLKLHRFHRWERGRRFPVSRLRRVEIADRGPQEAILVGLGFQDMTPQFCFGPHGV